MKLLLERGDDWYLGNRRIVGTDLGKSWLGPEESWLRVVDGDVLIVCESFVEAVESISGSYCALLRLWEDYKWQYGMWVYVGSGGMEIPGCGRHVGFVGEWPGVGWSRIRKGVVGLCNREYVIKREWLPGLIETLSGRGLHG